jgi:cytochrome c553
MIFRIKFLILLIVVGSAAISCFDEKPERFSISGSKSYEASMFRQNCAICHGPEAEGKTLEDGKQIPNLRHGPFKYNTDGEIYQHIAEGGNGMTPFRNQLTDREIRQIVEFVKRDLRGQ